MPGAGRRPYASINFVTAHDGFTLNDLVTYNDKHNEANGEDNRDGDGRQSLPGTAAWRDRPTIPVILALRASQMRNFLATLFLSQGVPMLCAGDEVARTQRGNNNAYCQDNEPSWFDWSLDTARRDLLAFTRELIALRRRHPVLRRRHFFQGRKIRGSEVRDLTWLRPDGREMTDEDWQNAQTRCLGLRLSGDAIEEVDRLGERITDDTFLLFVNAHHERLTYRLPELRPSQGWERVLDTQTTDPWLGRRQWQGGDRYELAGRSLALLRVADRARPPGRRGAGHGGGGAEASGRRRRRSDTGQR